jgi:bile acid:Na+ symporter, BASS family
MNETWMILFKISLVFFMAGNLLEMGLRLNPQDAIRGMRNFRFAVYTLLWGFVAGPVLAYGITRVIPLEPHYAVGLILMGMTPGAPFLPMLVNRAKGDPGYTAAFMLLVSAAMVIFMPFAVSIMVKDLTVSAWSIAKPLLIMIFIPLVMGMVILRLSAGFALKMQPFVRKITVIFAIVVFILCIIIFGHGLIGVAGSLAIISQLIFFFILTAFSYWMSFGLKHEQKIVLSLGMATRNLGAAIAPLFSLSVMDPRAMIMIVLGIPMMIIAALLATRWFSRFASSGETSQ